MKIEVDGVEYSPAVDISELPTHTMQFPAGLRMAFPEQSQPYVMLSDLRKVAVRDTEREKELETDLKEMAGACLTKQCKIVELEAENQRLRELVRYCWVNAGYKACGLQQMTKEQRELLDGALGEGVAAWMESTD